MIADLDTAALRRLATAFGDAHKAVAAAVGWDAFNAAVTLRGDARAHLAAALSPAVVLALLDRVEAAERIVDAARDLADAHVALDALLLAACAHRSG